MVASKSKKGKISEEFLFPSPNKLGVHVHPQFRHPCNHGLNCPKYALSVMDLSCNLVLVSTYFLNISTHNLNMYVNTKTLNI